MKSPAQVKKPPLVSTRPAPRTIMPRGVSRPSKYDVAHPRPVKDMADDPARIAAANVLLRVAIGLPPVAPIQDNAI